MWYLLPFIVSLSLQHPFTFGELFLLPWAHEGQNLGRHLKADPLSSYLNGFLQVSRCTLWWPLLSVHGRVCRDIPPILSLRRLTAPTTTPRQMPVCFILFRSAGTTGQISSTPVWVGALTCLGEHHCHNMNRPLVSLSTGSSTGYRRSQ